MSLYGTLPRNRSIGNRHRRYPLPQPLLPPTPPSTASSNSSASSSASSSSTFSTHHRSHLSIDQFISSETDPFVPLRSRLSSAYLPNSEYYTPSLVSSSTSTAPLKPLPLPSIISLNSLKYPLISKDDHSSVLSPTEVSDSVTFTETASFDDTTSSITISTLPKIKPKLYYASDSFEPQSENLRKRTQPNFYGVDDDDDEDDDDGDDGNDGGTDNNSEFDFYHMVQREYAVNSYRERRRRQSMSLDTSLFDPAIIGSPLCLTEAEPSSRKAFLGSRQPIRFGYRLSMRIKKLYTRSPTDTQSSDTLNTCASSSPKSRIQIRLRQLFQPPGKPFPSLGSLWKKKIVVVFNKAFSHSSLNSISLKSGKSAAKNSSSDEIEENSKDTQSRFVRSNSVAGIKKRPLSMTYDLERVTGLKQEKAHMVAAFEQSLSSMTTRLQQLSSSSEVKDCELDRLRKTIEILKQQGGSLVNGVKQANGSQFGRRKGSFTSDYTDVESPTSSKFQQRQLSTESVNSVSSCGETSKGKKKSKLKTLTGHNASWIRSSFSRAFKKSKTKGGDNAANREFISDAESGNEAGSCRPSSAQGIVGGTAADNSRSVPSSPLLSVRSFKTSTSSSSDSKGVSEVNNRTDEGPGSEGAVQNLQKQLREKEMQLTDMRLESLTSTHQLENLKEMLSQMRLEMVTLKQDNDRLQRLVSHKSLASSASSLATSTNQQMAPLGAADPNSSSSARNSHNLDTNSLESVEMDGMLSSPGSTCLDSTATLKPVTLGSGSHTLAQFAITSKTNWDALDFQVRKLFKEHLIRVDCHLSLGVTVDSLACYKVGAEQVQRNLQELSVQPTPELLPFGYLVENCHINLQFKSALDSLAFDTLTPKSILNQFLGLLAENRRLILAGPSGTGKTYLAHKLAEYLVIQKQLANVANVTLDHFGPAMTSGAIATFNVDHKNAKELRAYLSNIAEQCESLSQIIGDCPRSPLMASGHLPIVIILDNLHHIDDSLVVDIFNDLYRFSGEKSPYIIGTINQNVTSTQNISEMFHRFHFRTANFSVQTEPVKGFLTRYLRRKWLETEAKYSRTTTPDPQLSRITDWIPRVSLYLNRFLENFFPSQNVSIGPRLFTSCPIDVNGSQIWFTDLWNFSILPFITENLRDLLSKSRSSQGSTTQQMYSRLKEKFIDPTDWVIENYPWVSTGGTAEWSDHLIRLRLEDILEHDSTEQSASIRSGSSASGKLSINGKPPVPVSINDRIDQVNDPFLEMLIKLKEATEVNNSSQELSK